MAAIEIEGLGKRYRLGERFGRGSLRETIMDRLARQAHPHRRDVWVLRNLSLKVQEGEVVGIVGRNGAGKSTLLKILSRITEPTEGHARVRGRVGSLLEVGTGFHPELTGRENIALNGAVLGMSRTYIAKRFDEIVEFAGVERFLDTPVKRYSSGMYLRLAFSVAAHLEPEVMLIDEVLAVGDAEFQRRCLGKMSELHHRGRTVLFVSHDLRAIDQLCDRAVWIDAGGVMADGPTHEVLDSYLKTTVPARSDVVFDLDGDAAVQPLRVWLTDVDGVAIGDRRRDQPVVVHVRLEVRESVVGLDVSVYLLNSQGVRVIDEAWSDARTATRPTMGAGVYDVSVTIPPILVPGEYVVGIWIGTDHEDFEETEVLTFRVAARSDDPPASIQRARAVVADAPWSVETVTAPRPS